MSHVREYIGCKSVKIADYDGKGNNLYSMWLTDTEVVRCRDCEKFETVDCAVYRALRVDGRIAEKGMFNPDGFCAWAERREA